MQSVISSLEGDSSYWTARCYGHHRYVGGMADHALEVYNFMRKIAPGNIPDESIAIVALFHDLGKAFRGRGYHCDHLQRSLQRLAIGNHHRKSLDFLTCPLRGLLSAGDMYSTGNWKRNHRQHRKDNN